MKTSVVAVWTDQNHQELTSDCGTRAELNFRPAASASYQLWSGLVMKQFLAAMFGRVAQSALPFITTAHKLNRADGSEISLISG